MITNTTYALYKKGVGTENSHGDWVTGNDIFVKNICVDKQPYNSELLLKNYGYTIDVTNRLLYEHFGLDTDIKINNLLKVMDVDGVTELEVYEIRKYIPWDIYTDIFVYKIK